MIPYQPLHSGLLSGTFTRERPASLDPSDWRRTHPDFTTDLDTNLRTVDRLRTVAQAHGTAVGAVAIAWVLARRGVTGAIAGARRPEQTADWARAATLRLTEEELEFVAAR
ncbi:hypothetical protein BIV25_30690 [Streptomyces sp. MUSC 14]|nr:hypothetical protein BIV25_30690 [Streptomyces sp. MUSC 14]